MRRSWLVIAAVLVAALVVGLLVFRRRGPVDHASLGYDALMDGRTEDAIRELREASREAPKDAKVHYDLGIALERAGWMDQAVDEFGRARDLEPANATYAHGLAETDRTLGYRAELAGRHEDAIRLYRAALDLSPDDATTWYNLSVSHARLGHQTEAAEARAKADALRAREGSR